jgi:hypothetical protein
MEWYEADHTSAGLRRLNRHKRSHPFSHGQRSVDMELGSRPSWD